MIDVFIIFALLSSAYCYEDPVWAIAASVYMIACKCKDWGDGDG